MDHDARVLLSLIPLLGLVSMVCFVFKKIKRMRCLGFLRNNAKMHSKNFGAQFGLKSN
jgi:flagellar biogenesis protein FliO